MITSKHTDSKKTKLEKTLKSTASLLASKAYRGVSKFASTAKNIASIASSKAYNYLNKDIISKNDELMKNNLQLIQEIKDISQSNIKNNNDLKIKFNIFHNKLISPQKTKFSNLIDTQFNEFLKTQEKNISQSKINILKKNFYNKIKINFSQLNEKFSNYPDGLLVEYENFQREIEFNYGKQTEVGSVTNILHEIENKLKFNSSLLPEEINIILIRNNEFLLPLKKRVINDQQMIDEFKNKLNQFENEFDVIARKIFVSSALIPLMQSQEIQIHEESMKKQKEEEIKKQKSNILKQERLRKMREEEIKFDEERIQQERREEERKEQLKKQEEERKEQERKEDIRKAEERREQERKEQLKKQEEERKEQERREQQRREQERREQQRREQERREQERREKERREEQYRKQQRREQERREEQYREQQRREQEQNYRKNFPSMFKENIDKYYSILQLPPGAPIQDVKKKYKQLALKYHPDKNIGDKNAEEMMKKIVSARNIILEMFEKKGGSRKKYLRKNKNTKKYIKKYIKKHKNKTKKNI